MKTILITCYAISPYKGSEDGTGWNIVKEIAKDYNVIVITRKNNIPDIDRYFEEKPNDHLKKRLRYYGFDLPEKIMNFKKKLGSRGYVLYFYFWQLFIVQYIKNQKFKFDFTHALNFHSDSHPHFLWLLKKPCFWGPIGHHPKVPKEYLIKEYGIKNYVIDRAHFVVKWLMRNLDPLYRISVLKSEKIFTINSSIAEVIKADPKKVHKLPAVAGMPSKLNEKIFPENFNVLMVGRFHYMKGFDLGLKAYAKFLSILSEEKRSKTTMLIVGRGPEKERLYKIARKLQIEPNLVWIDWITLEKMPEIYRNSSVFLFPSHEGAGMVVPEALSFGLPIICFDNVGPGELAGNAAEKIPYSKYDDSVVRFAQSLHVLMSNKKYLQKLSRKALDRYMQEFTWVSKGEEIKNEYLQINTKIA